MLLLYALKVRWSLVHGVQTNAIHQMINYEAKKIFTWFVEKVTKAQQTGDVEEEKSLLVDVFKLLGNSTYGKIIKALERQTSMIYTADEEVIAAYFSNLDEIRDFYKV